MASIQPKGAKRRWLYSDIVRSMTLHGATAWVSKMRRLDRALVTSQRVMGIRMISMTSGEASNILAGLPPWDLEAKVLAREPTVCALRHVTRQISAWWYELLRYLITE